MSGTKLKLLYIRVPKIVAPALLVIGLAAYAQQSADKPIISLSTVSKLDRSQAGIYRTKIGKIDIIAVSDGTVGLGLTKELIQTPSRARLNVFWRGTSKSLRWTLPSTLF